MTSTKLVLLVLGLLGALALSLYTYRVLEPPGRGRPLLAALRALALALIVLLLFDPHLHTGRKDQRAGGTRVVLDASLSMSLNGTWSRALAEARRAAGRQPVLLAGSDVRTVGADSLSAIAPYAGESRVLPAIQGAAEAGAATVTLITDGAISDADELARWLPSLGITLDVRNVATAPVSNRAIRDVDAPAWAEAGKPLTIRAGVAASGNVQGSNTIIVRQSGRELARAPVQIQAGSGVATANLTFTADGPAEGGLVRYDVAFDAPDSIPDDDVRSIYVYVSDKPAGVAIVSFDPDWEPRFLHPVLADALGLPVRTFLRVPSGMYFRGGNGADAGARADEAEVQRAVREADLLVLHGMGANAPAWAQQALHDSKRLIVFPGDDGIRDPIVTSPGVEADWYISADVPASPIASLLAGMDISNLPPLTSLQSTSPRELAWIPLLAGRTPRDGTAPVAMVEQDGPRRWAVALGRGYWRWAFRGGTQKDAYARLWGALAGWLVQDQAMVAGAAIRPVQHAVARATAIRWVAPGIAADSFVLLLNGAGKTARTVMTASQGDTATSAPPVPGHYAYDIRAFSAGKEIARAAGPLTVESYSPEFIRTPADLTSLKNGNTALTHESKAGGRPLHTYAWLYVLLVALLASEWVLRRRWGLR